ncbi:MAG: M48 family metalloprotease [Planctomycetaceae bacterium]
MSIHFTCPDCGKRIRVGDNSAGKRGTCPGCGGRVQVPNTPGSPSPGQQQRVAQPSERSVAATKRRTAQPVSDDPAAADLPAPSRRSQRLPKKPALSAKSWLESSADRKARLEEQVLGAFTGKIKPVRRTMLYRIGVIGVAIFVVVLPVLYVALIGLAGWGVFWHATENTHIASMGYGRGRILAVMAYVAPIIAGSITVLFMLKPLLARSVRDERRTSLNRAGQPLLFEFVDKVCDAVHAPRPSVIRVTFDVNASAGFGNGLKGLFGSDLTLSIGLPLLAGMNLQQVAGILAHEFGHFSQGAAMRVSWVVRSINFWFARVVYTRDQWDQWLVEMSEEVDIRIGWIFYVARMAVFFSRGVLWCFMMLSHALTCWLMRQMEYDADRHEVRLVGSKTFESTCLRLNWLNYGLGQFFRHKRFAPAAQSASPNPIREFLAYCDTLNEMDEKRVRRRMEKAKTGLLDTHPSDADRIASAAREDADGIFSGDLPAEALIRNFDKLSLALMRV